MLTAKGRDTRFECDSNLLLRLEKHETTVAVWVLGFRRIVLWNAGRARARQVGCIVKLRKSYFRCVSVKWTTNWKRCETKCLRSCYLLGDVNSFKVATVLFVGSKMRSRWQIWSAAHLWLLNLTLPGSTSGLYIRLQIRQKHCKMGFRYILIMCNCITFLGNSFRNIKYVLERRVTGKNTVRCVTLTLMLHYNTHAVEEDQRYFFCCTLHFW